MAQTEERKALLKAASEVIVRCPRCGGWKPKGVDHKCVPKKHTGGRKKKKKAPWNKGLPSPNRGKVMATKPIKDIEDIQKLKEYVKTMSDIPYINARDYCIVVFMLNTNLRGCDIVRLTYDNLLIEEKGITRIVDVGEAFDIREKKTKKARRVYLNQTMKDALIPWLEHRTDKQGSLFLKYRGKRDGLTTRYISDMIIKASTESGIGRFSSHSLRKSHGRYLYEHCGVDIATLMLMYNHSTPRQTVTYLGITETEIKQAFMNEL